MLLSRRLRLALVLAFVGGCATTGTPQPAMSTLSIYNESGLAVGVYFQGRRLATVMGLHQCVKIASHMVPSEPVGSLRFDVTSEVPFQTPVVDLRDSWTMTVGPWPATRHLDVLTLRQTPRCN